MVEPKKPPRFGIQLKPLPVQNKIIVNGVSQRIVSNCEQKEEVNEVRLYFTSCPNGGEVENVTVLPCHHAVIVQFKDSSVATRLPKNHTIAGSSVTVRPLGIIENIKQPKCCQCAVPNRMSVSNDVSPSVTTSLSTATSSSRSEAASVKSLESSRLQDPTSLSENINKVSVSSRPNSYDRDDDLYDDDLSSNDDEDTKELEVVNMNDEDMAQVGEWLTILRRGQAEMSAKNHAGNQQIQNRLSNSVSTSCCIKQKTGIVRLLAGQSQSITDEINKNAKSKISLEFLPQEGKIQVHGCLNDVQEAIRLIENKYLKSVYYDTFQVNMEGLSLEMFTTKGSPGKDLIELVELQNTCVIEVREDSNRNLHIELLGDLNYDGNRASARSVECDVVEPVKKKNRPQLHQGSITEFKADVLVNPVAGGTLQTAGVVTQCFIKAGGPNLGKELKQLLQQNSGNDVLVTSAGGRLNAKFIFHAAIMKYKNRNSIDKLYSLIKKCLEMAAKQGATSIAFPTLGCGNLNYCPKEVAECFNKAMKNTGTDIQVSIIVFDDPLFRGLKSFFATDVSPTSSDNEPDEAPGIVGKVKRFIGAIAKPTDVQTSHGIVSQAIVFHINTMSYDVLDVVMAELVSKISEMTAEVQIYNDVIGDLKRETIAKIEALNSSYLDIKIDKVQNTITVKGTKSAVEQTEQKIRQILLKREPKQGNLQFPKYWKSHPPSQQPPHGASTTELSPGSTIFEEVSELVMKTWEPQKVGVGKDASGLGNHTLKIRKVFCIENQTLYRTYKAKRDEFLFAAKTSHFQPLQDFGEKEIMTRSLALKKLDGALEHKINECYLLHGTKIDTLESIKNTGLDSRLCGTSVMFGSGTYFCESSTKADQYADCKSKRESKGSPLYMVVCRVLLGNSFICQKPTNFKRPPCMQPGCHSDVCSTKHLPVGNFDSVIGTHKEPNTRLLFREFVIYHPDHSYPDFLVEYERQ